jgi:hypothetical protein
LRIFTEAAEQCLSIPADVFAAERYKSGMDGIAAYFGQHSTKAAKRLLIAFTGETPTKDEHSVVCFYDPQV